MERRFGISTHLFHDTRLTGDHVALMARHDFDAIEVFATRSHFDYRSDHAIADLAAWLSAARLELHSMHAPVAEAMMGTAWVGPLSNAAKDEPRRKAAVAEAHAAIRVAETIPFRYLVLHLGVPDAERRLTEDNQPQAARRSLEEIVERADAARIKVAIEVIPNSLSGAESLVSMVEDLDADVGICLDYGHAHLMGDLGEAIEAVSGHLWTTHVHDNRGRLDDHLVPFAGSIDWDAAMMATQKIGYDDVMMLEVAGTGDPHDVLQRAVRARERLRSAFVTF